MILVGPSLGAAVAIDFVVNHPEAVSILNNRTYDNALSIHPLRFSETSLFLVHLFQVEKLVLIDASVYAEGTGDLANLPRLAAYAGVSLSIKP